MKDARERRERGIVRVRRRRRVEAPHCVRHHMCAYVGGLSAYEDYGREVVEEVRGVTEGEGIVSGIFRVRRS